MLIWKKLKIQEVKTSKTSLFATFFAGASVQYGDEFDEDGDFMELDGYEPGNASGTK